MGLNRKSSLHLIYLTIVPLTITLVVGLTLIFAVVKTQNKATFKNTKAATTTTDYQQFVLDWPISDPTTVNVVQPPSGQTYLLLLKGSTYWIKSLPDGNWSSGKAFQEGTTKPGFILPAQADTLATFYIGADQWQTAINGTTWYSHKNSGPWNYTGQSLVNENSTCGRNLPQNYIDTFTIFPSQGKNAVIYTRDGIYYFKPDTSTITFTQCGYLLPGNALPPTGKFNGHTIFVFEGKQAELLVSGSTYWFFPDRLNRGVYNKGTINQAKANVSVNSGTTVGQIDQNIFGANLVWHQPFNIFNDAVKRTALANLINDMGITILRFPGGCGGDSYNWQSPSPVAQPGNKSGMTFTNYLNLIKQSGVLPYYTFNLEGEGSGHANLNCHGLYDYNGKITSAVDALNEAARQGVKINNVELGNEPWAGTALFKNWNETWTADEYANVQNQAINTLTSLFPGIRITSPWEASVLLPKSAGILAKLNSIQYHPYVFGNAQKDNPLTQAETVRTVLKTAHQASSKNLAVTEYNLYCWDGVIKSDGTNQYPINNQAGKMGNGIYIAQMLRVFAQENVSYAMVWNLFDSNTSTWKCGLIREDSYGNLKLTAAGQAFKIARSVMYNTLVSSSTSYNQLQTLVTRNSNHLGILLINPTSVSISTSFFWIVKPTTTLNLTQLSSPNLTDTTPLIATATKQPTEMIYLPAYSISAIKTDLPY